MKNEKNSTIYWNPYLEVLDAHKLQELQFKRFKEAFTFAYSNSPSYKKLYSSCGVNTDTIKCFDDIKKIPIVDKKFFDENKSGSFYGGSLAVPEEDVVFYHQTSGTTHSPIRQPDTLNDWYWWAECWASVLWAQGLRETDRVLIAFNYNLFIGFWGAHYGCEKIGAEIISAGSLTTHQRLEKILELDVTTIITTPTYVFRLMEIAKEKGIDLSKTSVKRIICAGEPGALIPSTKTKIESQWQCDVFDHIGATEVGAWGFECAEKPGGIHVNESMFLLEILDFDTFEVITEPNKFGYIVITSFYRSGIPCIRFNTNDFGCWQETPCECNRSYRILKGGVSGRVDHLLKFKGTLITPAVIEDIISTEKRLGREFIITIGEDNKYLEISAEIAPNIDESEYERIKDSLIEKIYNKTFLKSTINLKKNGELPRSDLKSNRVIDLRKKGG